MTQTHKLAKPKIIYPDTDGKPMAETTVQARYIKLISGGLDDLFSQDPDVFVAIDLFWYPVEGNNKLRLAPDVFVALGRPKGDRMTYLQWEEANTPPQVVFEIWSPGNRLKEKNYKFDFYSQYGVEEYYTYDPLKGELAGWRREGQHLQPLPNMHGWQSPLLKIKFELAAKELRLYRPDGQLFVSYEIMAARARQAEQRALQAQFAREQAEAYAEDERTTRELAQQQAERERIARELAQQQAERERIAKERAWAKLREMGIDPNSLN